MKIIITESQYSALLRRFSLIEPEFRYRLIKEEPCEYESFDKFFRWVSYRTADTTLYKILENDRNLKLDLEQSNKFTKMIQDFIYDKFSDDAKYFYDNYRKIICPKK